MFICLCPWSFNLYPYIQSWIYYYLIFIWLRCTFPSTEGTNVYAHTYDVGVLGQENQEGYASLRFLRARDLETRSGRALFTARERRQRAHGFILFLSLHSFFYFFPMRIVYNRIYNVPTSQQNVTHSGRLYIPFKWKCPKDLDMTCEKHFHKEINRTNLSFIYSKILFFFSFYNI